MKPLATRIAGSVVILSALGLSGVAVVLMLEEPGRVIGLVLVVLTYSSLILLAVELFARAVLRRSFATLVGQGTPSLRMEPHIFTHFIPSSDYPDIHDHFRRTSDGADSAEKTLYLAGDCVIFEDHLAPNQTMAYQLAAHLNGWRVLNAGAPHYTAAHAYSRLVFDVLRGYEAEVIVLFAGINDVLSFLHHDRGAVGPVYTHFYVPWVPYGGRRSGIRRLPSATLKLAAALVAAGRGAEVWSTLVERNADDYGEAEHIAISRQLFSTDAFSTTLALFSAISKEMGAQLVLTTIAYTRADMETGPRSAVAWGIDRVNEAIRNFSDKRDVKLIDLDTTIDLVPERDIRNKWHFTELGNAKRAEALAAVIGGESAADADGSGPVRVGT